VLILYTSRIEFDFHHQPHPNRRTPHIVLYFILKSRPYEPDKQ